MAAGLRRALCPSWFPVSQSRLMTSSVTSAMTSELRSLRLLREHPRVLHVQLHRPSKRNALDLHCWRYWDKLGGLVNELAFTARVMRAPEALSCGLVSRVLPDKPALLEAALEVAAAIAARSPVAVQGTKVNLLHSRDRPVSEGLQHMATWNMAMLQTEDIPKSVQAALDKKGPEDVPFAKL
uniref:delta(3,5)-Delta(2,4)-dienoyl-CoA isomerase, mitochondrial n=1 Tax=Lonchura striata TaxID=40157 RepID=UPI00129408AC|nr:delta(3,5)-Delta(2,4)-dienoyl-CoA isomerase, mitochondrial [Lonchura striata domestica]